MGNRWKIRGREITDDDIILIQRVIKEHSSKGRKYISCQICHQWKWYQANGQTKDMACRYIMLFLEKQGIIKLPPPLHPGNNQRRRIIAQIRLEEIVLTGTVKDYPDLKLRIMDNQQGYSIWNRIINTYHYQKYRIIVGKFLKYIAYIKEEPIACLGWGSAAWSLKPREEWIGWNKETKDKNLCGIVNNIRFLILPWVRIKYLASYLLGLSVRIVPLDWQKKYGHPIHLLETFVEKERFSGTCYKAANWIYLGETKGSAKHGSAHDWHGNIKRIFVYPLSKDFRQKLKLPTV